MRGKVVTVPPGAPDTFENFCKNRDLGVRATLISRHLPLVESIAKNFLPHGQGEPLEDLIQVGSIGLIKAVDRFDPTKDAQFSTYATHQISGEIRHYLRDKAGMIRQPRWLRFLTYQIYAEAELLAQKLGRFPTSKEIADSLNIAEEGIVEILRLGKDLSCTLLDVSRKDSLENLQKKVRSKSLVSFQLPVEDKIVLSNALEKLLQVEKKALFLFFYNDLTQTEIGKHLGLSQRAVSRVMQKGLGKLKKILTKDLW